MALLFLEGGIKGHGAWGEIGTLDHGSRFSGTKLAIHAHVLSLIHIYIQGQQGVAQTGRLRGCQ